MKNFWKKLPKPFFALAPMDDITDTVLRQMVCKVAKPDVFFTEFTNVDALASKGRDKVLPRLKYDKIEHPIVAQIWGTDPENFQKAAKDIKKMGFDGIDINMGCPISGVVKKGACAALIKNHDLAKRIIHETIRGSKGLPISVKTRLGFDKIETEKWIGFLLNLGLDAITIHGRTVYEMSKVPAHWDEIGKAINIRNKLKSKTLIIGNGDVKDRQDGLKKAEQFTLDGIMIGRGILSNIWVFEKNPTKHTLKDQLKLLLEHARLFETTWGKSKNFLNLRKFFKAYIHDFDGANDLRVRLMQTNSLQDVQKLLTQPPPI